MTVRPSPPFRDFEVSAILREVADAGSGKSQFRRPLKPQPLDVEMVDGDYWASYVAGTTTPLLTPFAIGDLLWCREAWAKVGDEPDDIHACPDLRIHAYYRADAVDPERQHWRPSTQIPRWASRLTLEVVGVKIERLQEISEDDARAEGMTGDDDPFWRPSSSDPDSGGRPSCRNSFEFMWDKFHSPGSWSANPFVAAVTFRSHLINVDEFLRQREGGR